MGKRVSAFTNDVMGEMDATELAAAIASKQISVDEVLEAAIKRAEMVNPDLNAIALRMYERARKGGNLSKGGLYGVPTFLKDNDGVKGYPTQMGTGAFKSPNAKKNSQFADQFLSTGLNLLGKSTLPELGLICTTENPKWGITRNPWNTDYTTGGSSSGSAALVASGVVPIASANDGAGSIRIPAAICGLIGLKPSRHRLFSIDGAESLPINIAFQGVLTRTVRDTALFYSEVEKKYPAKKILPMGYVQGPTKQRFRVVFFDNLPVGSTGHVDDDIYEAQLKTVKLLEQMGHHVDQVKIPIDVDAMVDYFLHYYGMVAYLNTNLSRFVLKAKMDKSQLEPFTLGLASKFGKSMLSLPKSISEMRRNAGMSAKFFEKYDLIMTPVLSHKTSEIGYFSPSLPFDEICTRAKNFATYSGIYNVNGEPSISLPVGKDSNGMPIGLQFAAPFGHDKRLLEFAYEMEEAIGVMRVNE